MDFMYSCRVILFFVRFQTEKIHLIKEFIPTEKDSKTSKIYGSAYAPHTRIFIICSLAQPQTSSHVRQSHNASRILVKATKPLAKMDFESLVRTLRTFTTAALFSS